MPSPRLAVAYLPPLPFPFPFPLLPFELELPLGREGGTGVEGALRHGLPFPLLFGLPLQLFVLSLELDTGASGPLGVGVDFPVTAPPRLSLP